MIIKCEAPGCPQFKFVTVMERFKLYLKNEKWCCPEHTERLNPTNPKYDDHDPNTNQDLNKYHK